MTASPARTARQPIQRCWPRVTARRGISEADVAGKSDHVLAARKQRNTLAWRSALHGSASARKRRRQRRRWFGNGPRRIADLRSSIHRSCAYERCAEAGGAADRCEAVKDTVVAGVHPGRDDGDLPMRPPRWISHLDEPQQFDPGGGSGGRRRCATT